MMHSPDSAAWRKDFAETQESFETWRGSRSRGARIPKALWEAALSLAGRHGVARTATTLKLDYYAVKRRLEGESPKVRAAVTEVATKEQPRFVEIPRPSPALDSSSSITCTIEIEGHPDRHAKLRLVLSGVAPGDLDRILRSLWSQSA